MKASTDSSDERLLVSPIFDLGRPSVERPELGTLKEPAREMRFVPMQARRGDYALFFRKAAVEITFEGERYLVVPQAAILALVRE